MIAIIATPFSYCNCFARSAKKNDSVCVKVITQVKAPDELQKFEKWFNERLQAFADEKKDFTVTIDSTQAIHTINVYIDSVVLVEFQKYKENLQSVDSVTAVSARITGNPLLMSLESNAVQGFIIHKSYESSSHPVMYARITIVDKTGKLSLKKKKELESISTVPVDEKQQISELFGILKVFVEDNIPYLNLD